MYSKEVTALILQDWAKGASAEETRNHIQEVLGVKPCLNTIYTHRNGLTAENLIDELLRQQQRDITKSDNEKTRMYFRNELIRALLPHRIEALSYHKEDININNNRNFNLTNYSEEDKIAILDAYRRLNKTDSGTNQPPSLH